MRPLYYAAVLLKAVQFGKAEIQDWLDGFTFGLSRRATDMIERVPVPSVILENTLLAGNFQNWEEDVLKSSVCTDLFSKYPKMKERADALGEKKYDFIQFVDDISILADMSPKELKCVMNLGYIPKEPPLGLAKGRTYQFTANQVLDPFIHRLWGGKVFSKTKCHDGSTYTMAVNSTMRLPIVYALCTISELPATTRSEKVIGANDGYDGRGALWLDYSTKFEDVCPSDIPAGYDEYSRTEAIGEFIKGTGLPFTENVASMLDRIGPDGDISNYLGLGRSNILRGQHMSMNIFNNPSSPMYAVDAIRWIGADPTNKIDFWLGEIYLTFGNTLRSVGFYNLKTKTGITAEGVNNI